jgi:hypothetical protein
MHVCLFCVCVCVVCCQVEVSDELITRQEESYRLWRVVKCVQETS